MSGRSGNRAAIFLEALAYGRAEELRQELINRVRAMSFHELRALKAKMTEDTVPERLRPSGFPETRGLLTAVGAPWGVQRSPSESLQTWAAGV
jgi:hypothetical protein